MSAKGQKLTGRRPVAMSASLDNHGGKCEHSRRDCQSKRLRGLEVDRKIELGRHKHRQFRRLFSLENAPRVDAGFTIGVILVNLSARRGVPLALGSAAANCENQPEGQQITPQSGVGPTR